MKTAIETVVSRRFQFCAAHRLLNHPGKCRWLHGHNYNVTVGIAGPKDEQGMVMDFGGMKERIGGWINDFWDHNTILHPDDPLVAVNSMAGGCSPIPEIFGDRAPFIMPIDLPNPTAENLAELLACEVKAILKDMKLDGTHSVHLISVHETETCSAQAMLYELED